MNYITIEDVDNLLGVDWTTQDKKAISVVQANTWLNARKICLPDDTVPDAILLAGANLAKLSSENKLYQNIDGVVKREKVKADTVEVETEYKDGSESAVSGDIQFINDLIAPYLCRGLSLTARICK